MCGLRKTQQNDVTIGLGTGGRLGKKIENYWIKKKLCFLKDIRPTLISCLTSYVSKSLCRLSYHILYVYLFVCLVICYFNRCYFANRFFFSPVLFRLGEVLDPQAKLYMILYGDKGESGKIYLTPSDGAKFEPGKQYRVSVNIKDIGKVRSPYYPVFYCFETSGTVTR